MRASEMMRRHKGRFVDAAGRARSVRARKLQQFCTTQHLSNNLVKVALLSLSS
jgi:hypothetical protein